MNHGLKSSSGPVRVTATASESAEKHPDRDGRARDGLGRAEGQRTRRVVPMSIESASPTRLITIEPSSAANEVGHREPEVQLGRDGADQQQQKRVQHQQEEAKRHDRDRQREDDQDRADERVDQPEDERHQQQLPELAAEVETRHDLNGHPHGGGCDENPDDSVHANSLADAVHARRPGEQAASHPGGPHHVRMWPEDESAGDLIGG